ncbi:hypothetical protein [Bradyrhizobium sp. dw_78]|uniref:hypothetical protein n=1 Tax=Bradyrhizobium sp. dw_78 TaxID=2719793 RepID=UPI001BD2F48B|nr:hypothetical protein [Bradyrhizobium sp. dw_78]
MEEEIGGKAGPPVMGSMFQLLIHAGGSRAKDWLPADGAVSLQGCLSKAAIRRLPSEDCPLKATDDINGCEAAPAIGSQ